MPVSISHFLAEAAQRLPDKVAIVSRVRSITFGELFQEALASAECLALHRGRSTMVWQTTVRNADGKLCAVVTQTQLVIDAPA